MIKVQARWSFEDVVGHLAHSLQHQAKPIRHAALGNLNRKLAANPEDTKQVLLPVEHNTIPPCRCATACARRGLHALHDLRFRPPSTVAG